MLRNLGLSAVLVWIISGIGAVPAYAEACPNPSFKLQLEAQRAAFFGKPRNLREIVRLLNGAEVGQAEIDDKHLFLCNTVLFSVARASALVVDLLDNAPSRSSESNSSARRVKYLIELFDAYALLMEAYAESSLTKDKVYQELQKTQAVFINEFNDISKPHEDRVLNPISKPDQNSNNSVFRIVYGQKDDLRLYEAFYDTEAARLVDFDLKLSSPQNTARAGDSIDLSRSDARRWESWADDLALEVRVGKPGLLRVRGLIPLTLKWSDGVRRRDRQRSVESILAAFYHFVGLPESSQTTEQNELRGGVEDVFPDDEGTGSSTDIDQSVGLTDNRYALAPGDCIYYRSPEDDDLFAFGTPSLRTGTRNKVAKERLSDPFVVITPPFVRAVSDLEELEFEKDGKAMHQGQKLNRWITTELDGATVHFVYSKALKNVSDYIRFKKGQC